ncbi:hypothetical protein DTW90_34640 [Neorhizobium sp. P12A]|nr:hypothetical protein DTW90_34640 [Neorhizobium sp. P12A]
MQTEISVLTEKLAPAPETAVAEAIKSLLAAGFALPSALEAERAPAVYAFALKGISGQALKRVVAKIIRGEYEINRRYVPSPPEFAILARSEDKPLIQELANARANQQALQQPSTRYVHDRGFKDLRITARHRADELKAAGYYYHSKCESLDKFKSGAKNGQYPAGAIHLWAIDEVWAPRPAHVSQPPIADPEFHEEQAA